MPNLSLNLDGDKYCALWGNNLMEGVVGFGDTEQEAIMELGKEIAKTLICK